MKDVLPEAWFADIIIDGLKTLYGLNVANRPASDQLKPLIRIWIDTLWYKNVSWVRELDSERLNKAFMAVYAEATDWITPAQYYAYLPPRQKLAALPPPKASPDTVSKEMTKMRGLLSGLVSAKKMQK